MGDLVATEEIRGIADSANGKLNGYTFDCAALGQRRFYATCHTIIGEVERNDNRLEFLYSDCFSAIKKGSCPALKMRKEEEAAGKSIYFQERNLSGIVTTTAFSGKATPYVSKYKQPEYERSEVAAQPRVKKDNSLLGQINSAGNTNYADAINDAMSKPQKEEVKVTEQPKIEPVVITLALPESPPKGNLSKRPTVPQESLLDMARRLIAAQSK